MLLETEFIFPSINWHNLSIIWENKIIILKDLGLYIQFYGKKKIAQTSLGLQSS